MATFAVLLFPLQLVSSRQEEFYRYGGSEDRKCEHLGQRGDFTLK